APYAVLGRDARSEEGEDVVGARGEQLDVVDRDPEERRRYVTRQRLGDLAREVEGRPVRERREESLGYIPNQGLHCPYSGRGKRVRDPLAQARVTRRIAEDHPLVEGCVALVELRTDR